MASPGKRHCTNSIGALSFPIECTRGFPDFFGGEEECTWPESKMLYRIE